MSDWLAFNDPFFTDREPYCNTVRVISKVDAVAYMRRVHPEHTGSDDEVLSEFAVVNWAWDAVDPASWAGMYSAIDW